MYKLTDLKKWLEDLGFIAKLSDNYLNIYQGDRFLAFYDDEFLVPTVEFYALQEYQQKQIEYLIDKYRGNLEYEAVTNF